MGDSVTWNLFLSPDFINTNALLIPLMNLHLARVD